MSPKFWSAALTWSMILFFAFLYYDGNWSSGAKECFAKGGTSYDFNTGCKRTQLVR